MDQTLRPDTPRVNAARTFGNSVAFTGLAAVAATGLLMIWLVMPERRRSAR